MFESELVKQNCSLKYFIKMATKRRFKGCSSDELHVKKQARLDVGQVKKQVHLDVDRLEKEVLQDVDRLEKEALLDVDRLEKEARLDQNQKDNFGRCEVIFSQYELLRRIFSFLSTTDLFNASLGNRNNI